MSRALPPTASVAEAREGAKLHAPAAARNAEAICEVLQQVAPAKGKALEIASGTGQHVVTFAAVLPEVTWQPTDIDAERLRSIDAYVAEAGLSNIAPAQHLDAAAPGWAAHQGPLDLIVLINLLHLISAQDVQTIIDEAAQSLGPGGTLFLYGPFARDGALTSEGDQRFDAQLRAADPEIGYKDTRDMLRWLAGAGLHPEPPREMPANNLALVARRRG